MKPAFHRVLQAVLTVAWLTVLSPAAYAHFIWATVEGGQVRFALLEDVNAAPDARFEQYVANLAPHCGSTTLTLGLPKAGARYAALPSGQSIVEADTTVRAKESEGGNYLLVYHARGAASLEAAATATAGKAEVRARREGDALLVSVHQEEWPVPNAEVWVHWPGAEAVSLRTDFKGEARFPWSGKPGSGFVGVRSRVIEPEVGEHNGIRYTSIHRWATLSFPLSGRGNGDRPFTRILRESYGHNHESAGNAAFNQTLFEGKLTRAQLEVHLQQRALIHQEVDRILNAAGEKVPYGAAQKQVLTLLAADLKTLGFGWPAEEKARPLTASFLQEIRESEKRGPFFALGVQHVYYGGITNGGRMIGEKIGETLGFTPTYYSQSDGYQPYLGEVNKISDPEARQEMIRGGQAAYRYIIASSNEDIFKTK